MSQTLIIDSVPVCNMNVIQIITSLGRTDDQLRDVTENGDNISLQFIRNCLLSRLSLIQGLNLQLHEEEDEKEEKSNI